ncbi:hypothetical protein PI124_g1868 [Phytophthora idaei]|nr:hypothetical protein PI125_g1564 [Phytophthora idaei]KAG3173256.1 hypothetical protein PI126_g915 [Phytophthora idaei]KAG3253560.1 hypothetical protein PI124_g1868 [Phytophthora idaei]
MPVLRRNLDSFGVHSCCGHVGDLLIGLFAISDINVGAGYLVVVAFLGLRVSANKEVNAVDISRVDGGKPAQVNMMTPA